MHHPDLSATRSDMNGSALHIGIVQARFNPEITNALTQACLAELKALKVSETHIHHVTVPGALEVPVALQALAQTQRFDALIADPRGDEARAVEFEADDADVLAHADLAQVEDDLELLPQFPDHRARDERRGEREPQPRLGLARVGRERNSGCAWVAT